MKVSPSFLKSFINEHKNTHNFISLDELVVLSQQRKEHKKPFIVMTFDDGYVDNYEYALPIFDEMHIPFTVYISNSFPEETAFLWWYIIEDFILKNDKIILSDGSNYLCDTKETKEQVFLILRERILKFNQANLEMLFKELFCNYKFDNNLYVNDLCLSWNRIKEMSNSPYCTIGAHTENHKTLSKLTEPQLEYEILGGKKKLERRISKQVKHFAYPFGTYNEVGEREVKYIKKCGFDTVCYSFGGEVNNKNIKKLLELPRIFFGELKK